MWMNRLRIIVTPILTGILLEFEGRCPEFIPEFRAPSLELTDSLDVNGVDLLK